MKTSEYWKDLVGTEQRLKKAFQRAWTRYPSDLIIADIRKAIEEILGDAWSATPSVIALEEALKTWERCKDIDNPPVMLFSIIRERQKEVLRDVNWETKFELGGGDEMAKAHAFGYDI